MKVNIIKEHPHYPIGEADVSDERGNYLIRVGVATGDMSVKSAAPKEKVQAPKKVKEKKEIKPKKEKVIKP